MNSNIQTNTATNTEILIIGGGLAGLVNAIHLSKLGLEVVLIEKNQYPKHKVCGEYISNEVLPYLRFLDADPMPLGAKKIRRFQMSTVKGQKIEAKLPMGGFGISRYALDDFLFQKAKANGCKVLKDTVNNIDYRDDHFEATTKGGHRLIAKVAIGAFGKRSNLDRQLHRSFIQKRSPFLAVKRHFAGQFPDDLVALHNFQGGYCGISKVENDHINVCYLADYQSFKKIGNIDGFEEEVLFKNQHLKQLFKQLQPVFEHPLTISQISFLPKNPVEKHILMSGDAAGMIHPLCGNGMAMAIHSAKLLSELLEKYFAGSISTRRALEFEYSRQWNRQFRKRLMAGRVFQKVFKTKGLLEILISGLNLVPDMLPLFIRQTHGRPIIVEH